MAESVSMAPAELVRKAEQQGDVDFLCEGVRVLSQALMEAELSQHMGAAPGRGPRRPRAGCRTARRSEAR